MSITLSHDHIAIRVVDYAGTLRWYREKLDVHVDVEWPYGDMQLAYLSNGTAKVEVLGGATAEGPRADSRAPRPGVERADGRRRHAARAHGARPRLAPRPDAVKVVVLPGRE